MDISQIKTSKLKTLLKEFSNVSLGLRDIILKQQIEDEIIRRIKNDNI